MSKFLNRINQITGKPKTPEEKEIAATQRRKDDIVVKRGWPCGATNGGPAAVE